MANDGAYFRLCAVFLAVATDDSNRQIPFAFLDKARSLLAE